jgi:hypothetical protein
LALGFIAGLVLLLFTFASSLLLGGLGFVVMLASAFFFERNLRKMGQVGWADLTKSLRAGGLTIAFGKAGKRMRERFKRGE